MRGVGCGHKIRFGTKEVGVLIVHGSKYDQFKLGIIAGEHPVRCDN